MKELILVCMLFLTGCTITGTAVAEIEPTTLLHRDKANYDSALVEEDISYCYSIQTQPIREECFLALAQKLQDPTICNNLLGSLQRSCKAEISS